MILGTAVLVLTSGSALAQSMSCADLDDRTRDIHRTLYERAIIAEAAYGESTPNDCSVNGAPVMEPGLELRPVLLSNSEEIKYGEAWRLKLLSFAGDLTIPERLERYVNESTGTRYFSCSNDESIPMTIFLTWEMVRRYRNGDPYGGFIFNPIVLISASVLSDVANVPGSPLAGEEISFVRLQLNSLPESPPEEVIAFRGTDLTEIESIRTSLQALVENSRSCGYNVGKMIVRASMDELREDSSLMVVGHSLGGSITQYAAQEFVQHPRFEAYSFSAIGTDQPIPHLVPGDEPRLHSYIIDGDIVPLLGPEFGNYQRGMVIKFFPPASNWPQPASILGRFVPVEIRRHQIRNVKEGLCECMRGNGSMTIEMRN